MQLPKLTPLQSRFTASLTASVILLLVYLSLNKPAFAYAHELDSRIPPDHNHPILDLSFEDGFEAYGIETIAPDLRARAESGVGALNNNDPQNMNIEIGTSQFWEFTKESIDGPHGTQGTGLPGSATGKRSIEGEETLLHLTRRQSNTTVWVTLNTCLQPSTNTSDATKAEPTPPQLQMYISRSDSNQKPGPSVNDPEQQTIDVEGGYAIFNTTDDSSIYIGILAPNTTQFSGIWNYEIAASNDAPYHSLNSTWSNLYFVDSDDHSALLVTDNLTQANSNETVYQEWMSMRPPFGVFAAPRSSAAIYSVRNSYCGLKNSPAIFTNLQGVVNQNTATMVSRGLGQKPKEQFYITNLTSNTPYWGILALQGNSTASGAGVIGGGGSVFGPVNFVTKSLSNCALMYNLSFCSEVAYAVPSNPDLFPPLSGGLPELENLYDNNAKNMYQYFDYALQQIPCNTTSTAQYSLVRNCTDCAAAYKQWLCAVTIPRCEDFNNTAPFLKPRNLGQTFLNGSSVSTLPDFAPGGSQYTLLSSVATNTSRNPLIDNQIRPGPYKEVLPCEDLCYDLVQSCPAALGFSCPLKGHGLYDSYGARSNDSDVISCSYLGAAHKLSGSDRVIRRREVLNNALIAATFVVFAMTV